MHSEQTLRRAPERVSAFFNGLRQGFKTFQVQKVSIRKIYSEIVMKA
jgi:hypothetical protein